MQRVGRVGNERETKRKRMRRKKSRKQRGRKEGKGTIYVYIYRGKDSVSRGDLFTSGRKMEGKETKRKRKEGKNRKRRKSREEGKKREDSVACGGLIHFRKGNGRERNEQKKESGKDSEKKEK